MKISDYIGVLVLGTAGYFAYQHFRKFELEQIPGAEETTSTEVDTATPGEPLPPPQYYPSPLNPGSTTLYDPKTGTTYTLPPGYEDRLDPDQERRLRTGDIEGAFTPTITQKAIAVYETARVEAPKVLETQQDWQLLIQPWQIPSKLIAAGIKRWLPWG